MADIILGIESSCDDTSAAVLRDGVLLSNVIASQQVHKDFGGVVPELASRAHEQNIVPVVSEALRKAGVAPEDLTAVAFTRDRASWVRSWWARPSPRPCPCRWTSRW